MLAKVGYLNAQALFHLRFKNYSFALEAFASIFRIFEEKAVDCGNEIFLSSLSNYLSCLGRAGKKAVAKR